MVTGRADARPGWSMRMARTAPDCGQIGRPNFAKPRRYAPWPALELF